MKKLLTLLFIFSFLLSCKNSTPLDDCPAVNVLFSPRGGITYSIVAGIGDAENNIYVQAFSFTSKPIAEALVSAKDKGVNVEVILDRENLGNKNSVINYLFEQGVKIYIDDRHAIAHNKVLIIDDKRIFTGSFNLSRGAEEHNAENSVSIVSSKIAGAYVENWQLHKEHSYLFEPK